MSSYETFSMEFIVFCSCVNKSKLGEMTGDGKGRLPSCDFVSMPLKLAARVRGCVVAQVISGRGQPPLAAWSLR